MGGFEKIMLNFICSFLKVFQSPIPFTIAKRNDLTVGVTSIQRCY